MSRKLGPKSSTSSSSSRSDASTKKASPRPAKPGQAEKQIQGSARSTKDKPSVTAEGSVFAELPKLANTPPEDQRELFCRKMRECSTVFDFSRETDLPSKEGKRQTLFELVEYVTKSQVSFDEPLMRVAMDMVSANIFRTLKEKEHAPVDILEPEDDIPTLDTGWQHLEAVYEFFQQVTLPKDADSELTRKFVTKAFVTRLLDMFNSEDPREREALKTVLNRIYGRFSSLRSWIRQGIQYSCLRAAYEDEGHNGLAELLEIMLKIISNFKVPLQAENKELMDRVLIPLHKVGSLSTFHEQLKECTKKFVEKDPTLSYNVVMALFRFWPLCMASKQILFLNELEDMLVLMPEPQFTRAQGTLARRLAGCISCPNSDVAERALSLWRNDKIVKLITKHCRDQFPIIVSALYENATQHWHSPVLGRTLEVLKLLMVTDPELFDASSAKHRKEAEEEEKRVTRRERNWALLQKAHDKKREEDAAAAAAPAPASAKKSFGLMRSASSNALMRSASGGTKAALARARAELKPTGGGFNISEFFKSGPGPAAQKEPSEAAPSCTNLWDAHPDGLPLEEDHYGIGIYWNRNGVKVNLGLQALLVDSQGKITSAVHDLNRGALKAAVRHERGEPACGRSECGGVIWVALPQLPEQVVLLIFVVATYVGHLGSALNGVIQVVAESMANGMVELDLSRHTGDVGTVAMIKRSGRASFCLVRTEDFSKGGRHFMDILEPTLGRVIREALPTVPKRQKACLAFARMERGAVADLPQPSGCLITRSTAGESPASSNLPKWLFVGVDWDLVESAGDDLLISVSAVFFDVLGRTQAVVSPENAMEYGTRHSGSGRLGAGIIFDLLNIPHEVVQVFIIANVPVPTMTFELVQGPHCCVVDPAGNELASYHVAEAPEDVPGLLIARLFRVAGRGRWGFQGVGKFCSGHTWQDSLTELKPIFHTSPVHLQSMHQDTAAPRAPRHMVLSL